MRNNTYLGDHLQWIPDPNMALVCAYIAADVYNPASAPQDQFIAAWERIKYDEFGERNGEELYNDKDSKQYFQQLPDIFDTAVLSSFFARCYRNHAKELVIAYRGTANWENGVVDRNIGVSRWTGRWNSYDEAAIAFYHYILKKVQSQSAFPTPIWLTGHSLGGYLAQIVAALNPHNTIAIVFDAPGVGGLNQLIDNGHFHLWPFHRIKGHDQNIFEVNSSVDDPVHYTGGYQIGKVYNFPDAGVCQHTYSPFNRPIVNLIDYGLCEHAIATVLAQAEKYKSEEQHISSEAGAVYKQELAAMQK